MSTDHDFVLEVAADAAALSRLAAARFTAVAQRATAATGRCIVALSGGTTPKNVFELLATPAWSSRIDWARLHLCWGDERCVPPDDASSNYRMTREALLDHVQLPPENIHRMHTENAPDAAAAAYEGELRRLFTTPVGPPSLDSGRRFDLVLLGLGDDGHTASLFPHQAAVDEDRRWVMAEYVAAAGMSRVTLTPPLLNAAAEIVFLVAGSPKAKILARVLVGPKDRDALPAQRIAPIRGTLRWLVDAAAAAEVEATGGLASRRPTPR